MPPELHPLTQKYPPMDAEEFAAFKADLAANGLKNPIWLFDGKVLDGRNRLRGCLELGLDPVFAEFEGSEAEAAAFVDSQNLHRRHLSREWRQQRVREMRDKGQSSRSIARELGCSHFTVLRDLASVGEGVPTDASMGNSERSLNSAEPYGTVETSVGTDVQMKSAIPDPKLGVAAAERKSASPTTRPVGRYLPTDGAPTNSRLAEPLELPEHSARRASSETESHPAPKPTGQNPRVTGSDGKSYRAQRPAASKPKPAPKEKAQWAELATVLSDLAQKVENLVPTPEENERPWELISSLEKTAASLLRQAQRLRRRHHL